MDLYFCDLCQQAIPQDDIDRERASLHGGRVVCRACNESMGTQPASPPAAPIAPGLSSPAQLRVAGAPRPRIGPGVAFTLSMAAILLTLVAVVALLSRVENIGDRWDAQFGATQLDLDKLHEREFGTRDYMVTRVGQVAEEVLQGELTRLETIERQVGELRQLLLTRPENPPDESSSGDSQPPSPLDPSLLTAGDAMDRVQELEDQIQFLQARVFELLEGEYVATSSSEEPLAEQPPVLPGTVGELVVLLGHEDPVERAVGLFGLSTIQDPGIVRHVIPLLEDQDLYLRVLAARTLERVNGRSAGQALINALEDSDPAVRQAVASALRAVTGQQFLFDPLGPRDERARAVRKWRAWWKANWRDFLYG